MDTSFTALLKTFIDCYEADPDLTEIHLWNAQDEIRFVSREESYRGESKAKRVSQKRTKQAVKKRLLGQPDAIFEAYQRTNRPNPKPELGTKGLEATWAEFYEDKQYQVFLSLLGPALNMTRAELDEWIASKGYSREQMLSIMRDPKWKEIEAEVLFSIDSGPNLHLYFAKEFAASLDTVVAKIERLDEIKYRQSIPDYLKGFMQEAYRCDLYGLEAACASLCGSILQEAIRVKLEVAGFSGLFEAIEEAQKACLLTPRAIEAAEEVKRLRDLAAHGNPGFSNAQEYSRKSVLAATREILDTLFAAES